MNESLKEKFFTMLGFKRYFPSGKYGGFPDLSRSDVAKMIRDFYDENEEDFTKHAFYSFIENSPEIDWMISVSDRLGDIDMNYDPENPGLGLLTDRGKKEALLLASNLESYDPGDRDSDGSGDGD